MKCLTQLLLIVGLFIAAALLMQHLLIAVVLALLGYALFWLLSKTVR